VICQRTKNKGTAHTLESVVCCHFYVPVGAYALKFIVVFSFLIVLKMFQKLSLPKNAPRILKEVPENMKAQGFTWNMKMRAA
jgi:hypothetical protein